MKFTVPFIIMLIVIALIVFFVIRGYKKGLLRILFATFSVVITFALTALLTQPVSDFFMKSTFLGPAVEKSVSSFIDRQFEKKEPESGSQEDDFIDSLALPGFIKEKISENNTLTKYRELGISSFSGYITSQLTNIIIRAITFIFLAIVIYLLLKVLSHILNILQKIPVLHGINSLLGSILSLAEVMLIIWGISIFIMALSGTDFGTSCMKVIRANGLLAFIYDNNLLLSAVRSVFPVL